MVLANPEDVKPFSLMKPLRQQTREVIHQVTCLFDSLSIPKPIYGKQCQACSLIDLCNPRWVDKDKSRQYVEGALRGNR